MDIPQVINLTLKKGIKQGAFGKLYSGIGLKGFYEAGAIINVFKDTTQLSLIGFANNINRSAFSLGDVKRIGGFERGGYGTLRTGDNGYSIDNISFGGMGEGLQKIAGAGVNFNTLLGKKAKFNSKYFYGHNNTFTTQNSNDLQTLGTTTINSLNSLTDNNKFNAHNISGKIVIDPSSTTQLIITPSFSISPRTYKNGQDKITSDIESKILSTSIISNSREALAVSYKLSTDLYKDFKKAGRTLYFGLSLLRNRNNDDNFNSSNNFLAAINTTNILQQLRNNDVKKFEGNFTSYYTDPLSKKLKLNLAIDGSVFDNTNLLNTFYRNPINNDFDIIVPSLSENVRQEGFKTNSTFRLIWTINNDLSIQPALIFSTINIANQFVALNNFNQKFNFLNPGLNIRYKKFSIDYVRSFTEPNIQYIQPIPNNVDPLFIQLGNENLVPSRTDRIYVNWRKYDGKKAMNYSFYINASVQHNGIIMSRFVDQNGAQISKPINTNGVKQISNNGSLTKSFKHKNNQLTLNLGYFFSAFDIPIEVNAKRSQSFRYMVQPNVGIRANLNDKIEIFENYYFSYNKSTYQDNFFSERSFISHTSDTELIIRLKKRLVFESNFNLLINNQDIAGFNNSIKILNAGCTYLFMKNDRAQLKVSINDILQNNVKRYVSIYENLINNTQINNIGRYGLITLTYNIRNFKDKVGGKERFLGF